MALTPTISEPETVEDEDDDSDSGGDDGGDGINKTQKIALGVCATVAILAMVTFVVGCWYVKKNKKKEASKKSSDS